MANDSLPVHAPRWRAVVKALDEFFAYALSRPGVVSARKYAIARWTLADPASLREPLAT